MANLFEMPKGINKVETRKKLNKMISEARKRAKPKSCILCGRTGTSFCNSHSVPQMALRSIADNGIVLHASAALGVDNEIINVEDALYL